MGVVIGLILVAFGAILTWGVNADVSGLNVTAVGVILLVIGIVVVLLDFLWWRTWTWYSAGPPWRRTTYVRDTAEPVRRVETVPRRRVVRRGPRWAAAALTNSSWDASKLPTVVMLVKLLIPLALSAAVVISAITVHQSSAPAKPAPMRSLQQHR